MRRVTTALKKNQKDSIVLNLPIVGFMINKLQHARFHETYHLMEQEISGVADINKFAKWMLGPRVCVTGLGFYDWSGRDIESYKARAEHKLQQLIHPLKNDG